MLGLGKNFNSKFKYVVCIDYIRLGPYFMCFELSSSGLRDEPGRKNLEYVGLIHLKFCSLNLALDLLIILILVWDFQSHKCNFTCRR